MSDLTSQFFSRAASIAKEISAEAAGRKLSELFRHRLLFLASDPGAIDRIAQRLCEARSTTLWIDLAADSSERRLWRERAKIAIEALADLV